MTWFWIALVNPLLHAAVNHFDKFLVSKYFKTDDNKSPVGALILYSAIFAVILLPFILLFTSGVFDVIWRDRIILSLSGMLLVLAYIFYFYALDRDEATIVAPLFQMIPIFGFILGYLLLGETLTKMQIIGSVVIIAGSVILALNLIGKRIKFKKSVVLFMAGSSLCYALAGVLFKFVAEFSQNFWPSLFWDFVGKIILGIIIFIFIKSYRQSLLLSIKNNRSMGLLLNSTNEILSLVGEMALMFAALLAPIALVQVVSGFQPLFVFVFGVVLTLFLPTIGKESLSKASLMQKILGIIVIITGTILINL